MTGFSLNQWPILVWLTRVGSEPRRCHMLAAPPLWCYLTWQPRCQNSLHLVLRQSESVNTWDMALILQYHRSYMSKAATWDAVLIV